MMLSRLRKRRSPWLGLLLAAALLRALIPSGFMLGRQALEGGYGLILCSEQNAQPALKGQPATAHSAASPCAFALSMAAALPASAPPLPLLRPAGEFRLASARPSLRLSQRWRRPPPRAPPLFL